MPKTTRDVPPPLELLCLRTLWSLGEANVREVREVVAVTRPLAYTTIMTVLDRLVKKGMITRRKSGRAFIYSPTASRDLMRRTALRELLDAFFDSSQEELIGFLRGGETKAAAAGAGGDGETRIDTVLL